MDQIDSIVEELDSVLSTHSQENIAAAIVVLLYRDNYRHAQKCFDNGYSKSPVLDNEKKGDGYFIAKLSKAILSTIGSHMARKDEYTSLSSDLVLTLALIATIDAIESEVSPGYGEYFRKLYDELLIQGKTTFSKKTAP